MLVCGSITALWSALLSFPGIQPREICAEPVQAAACFAGPRRIAGRLVAVVWPQDKTFATQSYSLSLKFTANGACAPWFIRRGSLKKGCRLYASHLFE